MVKIVIAGGSGNVAREVLAVLLRRNHEVTIFSRSNKAVDQLKQEGLSAVQVNYTDKAQLVKQLQGVNTVLSFIVVASDPGNVAQKALIDTCVPAGVKRFAPNEWSTRSNSGISWYAAKDDVVAYLREINREKKILEYTLFQPGLFLNYLSYPIKSAEYFHNTAIQIDFLNRRAIVIGDGDAKVSWTSVQDLGAVVAAAIEYPGEWPERGGMRGGRMSLREVVELGERIRGGSFKVEHLSQSDLETGVWKASWVPMFDHPNVNVSDLQATNPQIPGQEAPEDPNLAFSRLVVIGSLLSMERGVWDVSDEWNCILKDVRMTGVEEFLEGVWKGVS